jgi:hypothetical protein
MSFCSNSRKNLRLSAAGLCLVAFLQVIGIVPVLLSLAASLEGSHAVCVSSAPERVSVILQHPRSIQLGQFRHQHGTASRFVCFLAGSPPSTRADHIASFADNLTTEMTPQQLQAKRLGFAIALEAIGSPIRFSEPLTAIGMPDSSRLAFSSSAFWRSLRTTVLLI